MTTYYVQGVTRYAVQAYTKTPEEAVLEIRKARGTDFEIGSVEWNEGSDADPICLGVAGFCEACSKPLFEGTKYYTDADGVMTCDTCGPV